MGKASKWFRGLLGLKKSDQQMETTTAKPSKDKRRWSFVKSFREKDNRNNHSHGSSVKHRDQSATTTRKDIAVRSIESAERVDADKHAIAVAAATAAVAEAAVAAAHAAAAVVRLTNSGRCGNGSGHVNVNSQIREVWAAVKIQAAFRGCLARKALRALKGLVRLQALVRGHIERKRTAAWLLRMQAILRAQARARAGRAQMSELSQSSSKSSHFHPPGPPTPEKFEHDVRTRSLKFDQPLMLRRNNSGSNYRAVVVDQGEAQLFWHQSDGSDPTVIGDSQRDRILDIDMAKANRKTFFHSSKQALSFDQHSHSFTTSKESNHQTPQYSSSCEIQSLTPLKFSYEGEGGFCTAENSPQFHSASSKGVNVKRSPFTPTKSDGSSYLSGYSDYPSYMSFTESSRAKIRSLSAPRQRPQYERSLSTKRSSAQSNGDHFAQKVTLHSNFTSKAYPGSGRLDRLGMPVMQVGHRY